MRASFVPLEEPLSNVLTVLEDRAKEQDVHVLCLAVDPGAGTVDEHVGTEHLRPRMWEHEGWTFPDETRICPAVVLGSDCGWIRQTREQLSCMRSSFYMDRPDPLLDDLVLWPVSWEED